MRKEKTAEPLLTNGHSAGGESIRIPLAVRILIPALMVAMTLSVLIFTSTCLENLTGFVGAFNYGMNVCGMALLCFLAVAVFLDVTPPDRAFVLFASLIVAIFLGVFTNAICVLVARNVRFLFLNRAATFLCCLASPLTCYLYCCYQQALFHANEKFRRIFLTGLGVLALFDVLFFIFNLKFGYVYTIDEQGQYIPGKLYSLYMLYPLISMLSSMFVSGRVLAFELKKGILLSLFFVCFAASGALIAVTEEIDCSFVFFALAAELLYGTIQASRGREISEKNEMLAKQAVDLVKKEQQIMISQINPHFLYNTLSTIECLCETDPVLAGETVHNFADFLRGNVDTLEKAEAIPFTQEMAHLGHYVSIEMLRFPHIVVDYDLADTDFSLPSLTVQPLVENAIRYGVRTREDGRITVRSYFENMTHFVEIEDNGCGFDVNEQKTDDGRTHIGISNVRSRLEKMVNGNLVIVSKIGSGTKAIISIPAKKEENE